MVNDNLEDLENRFTLQLNQVEEQVTKLQAQELEWQMQFLRYRESPRTLQTDNEHLKNLMVSF